MATDFYGRTARSQDGLFAFYSRSSAVLVCKDMTSNSHMPKLSMQPRSLFALSIILFDSKILSVQTSSIELSKTDNVLIKLHLKATESKRSSKVKFGKDEELLLGTSS